MHERYAGVVFGFVLSRVPQRELAEEISADVWLGCWRSARAFRGESRVLTWLLGIASRQIHTHMRGKRLSTVPLVEQLDVAGDASNDPAMIVSDTEAAGELIDAIRALPAPLYEVVALAWLHELPYDEIAVAVSIPVGTVKSRVSRARALLHAWIGEGDE
nr:RNA polymerase sigma factor [Microbacterium lacticum]